MKKIKRSKSRVKLRKVEDWRQLKPQCTLKASGGPYYKQNGSKTYLAYSGICKVREVKENGLLCSDNYNGTVFIYMGPTKPGVVGILEAHKLKEIIHE